MRRNEVVPEQRDLPVGGLSAELRDDPLIIGCQVLDRAGCLGRRSREQGRQQAGESWPRRHPRQPAAYEMNSSSVPSGSRK